MISATQSIPCFSLAPLGKSAAEDPQMRSAQPLRGVHPFLNIAHLFCPLGGIRLAHFGSDSDTRKRQAALECQMAKPVRYSVSATSASSR